MFLWTLLASRIDCYLIRWYQIAFTYFTLNSRFCIMYLQNEASPSFVFLRFRISLFIDDCNFPLLRWVRWVFQVSSYQAMAINDYDLLKFCYTAFLVVFTLWEVAFDSYNVNIQQLMNHSTLSSLQKFFTQRKFLPFEIRVVSYQPMVIVFLKNYFY